MMRGKPFPKGHPKRGGRKKGTPNKVTRAVKQFLAELIDDPQVQARLRRRIMEGDTGAFFRAVEHVIGKPRQSVEQQLSGPLEIRWKDSILERIEAGRKRVADARD
jgi:hypothetical protein